jgi:hypothetical protein
MPAPVVCLDMDQTLVDWSWADIVRSSALAQGQGVSTARFVAYLHEGAARPDLGPFLADLAYFKAQKQISEVVMFTAATNKTGWVDFAVACIEEFAQCPKLFDRVLHRKDTFLDGGLMVKDMRRVTAGPVLMIDDRPECVINGPVLAVPAWSASVDPAQLTRDSESGVQSQLHKMWTRTRPGCDSDAVLKQCIAAITRFVRTTQQDEHLAQLAAQRLQAPADSTPSIRRCPTHVSLVALAIQAAEMPRYD